jgi:ssDNA-binding replication factor A large subunit
LVYYIAKGIVKTANKKFSNLKSDYEITLTNDINDY